MSSHSALVRWPFGTVRQSETGGLGGGGGGGGGLDDSSPLSWIPRAAVSLCVRLSDSTCAVRTLPSGRLTAEGFIAKCSQMVSPPTSVDPEWAELKKKKGGKTLCLKYLKL